jgi:hypothetical protein
VALQPTIPQVLIFKFLIKELSISVKIMKYTLNAPDVVSDWKSHEFYQSAIVLGVDSGIDGIGICLRKGPDILFAHTFLVGDTTKTLEERRLKRGWRRARKGRKKRESLLKDWVVRHKILSKERVNEIWHDPKVFQNAFKHRLRGMEQKLGSGEALVSCLRHAIQHRGFDYHLNGGGGFPWGDAMDFPKIIQWAKTGCCPQGAPGLLHVLQNPILPLHGVRRSALIALLKLAARRTRWKEDDHDRAPRDRHEQRFSFPTRDERNDGFHKRLLGAGRNRCGGFSKNPANDV